MFPRTQVRPVSFAMLFLIQTGLGEHGFSTENLRCLQLAWLREIWMKTVLIRRRGSFLFKAKCSVLQRPFH